MLCTTYSSPAIYVSLPSAMPLNAVWIGDITVDGKAAECATLPRYVSRGNASPVQFDVERPER